MRILRLTLIGLLLSGGLWAQNSGKPKPAGKPKPSTNMVTTAPVMVKAAMPTTPTPTNTLDSASYALGMLIGENMLKQIGDDFNKAQLIEGLVKTLKGEPGLFSAEQANQLFTNYSSKMQEQKSAAARADGEAFLAKNKARQGVVTTATGLQYEVLQKGTGTVHPTATDKVKVHYHGTLIDGTVFDSSVERGQPITFGLNQVIAGWTEGVQLMVPGDKFRFYLPYNLAYGEYGSPPKIKPYAALIFDVELIEVVK